MTKIQIGIFLSIVLLFSSISNTRADVIAPRGVSSPEVLTVPPIVTQIQQGKDLLQNVKLNYTLTPVYTNKKVTTGTGKKKKTVTKKVLTGHSLSSKDIALAILNPATGEVKVTKGTQKGTEFSFTDKNFTVKKVKFNGVNTRFQVTYPHGGTVVALKYLITPNETGTKAEIAKATYDALYVPYSPELQTQALANIGNQYLLNVLAEVNKQLAHIPSVSQPGKSVPEAIKASMVRSLLYAEHMDTWEFQVNPNTQQLVDKVNILLGANQGDTWKYSVSSAGAAGLAQFIPSTYQSLVNRHKDAKLIPDFTTGMRDHINAVKATYLLLDDYIDAVRVRAAESFIPGHAFDYGVAAYNGGTVRVAKAAKAFGTNWYQLQPDTENSLRSETAAYVAKIHRLAQLFNDQPILD